MKSPSLARWAAGIRRGASFGISAGFDFAFPPACVGCGDCWDRAAHDPLICPSCLGQFASSHPSCQRCAAPIAPSAAKADDCALCRGVRLHFDRAVALGVYRDTLREFVLRMKHAAGESLTLALGGELGKAALRTFEAKPIRLIAPLPMPWTRRLTRTANSAELLSEAIGAKMGLPVMYRALRCRRNPRRQSSLPPSKRFANVRGAYLPAKGYDFSAAHVLLVDDIMTTGATASEAAKALKKAGAAEVSVAVVARGIGDV